MPVVVSHSALKTLPFFSSLSDADIEALLPALQVRSYAASTSIACGASPLNGLYLVLSGCLKLVFEDGDGRHMIAEYLGPNEFVGECSLVEEQQFTDATVSAHTACELLYLPRKSALECVQRNAAVAMVLLNSLSRRLSLAHRKIASLGLEDVQSRVVSVLLDRAPSSGKDWQVDIGSELMAATVGASREMVSRVIKGLINQGLLRREKRRIVVPDVSLLSESVTTEGISGRSRREAEPLPLAAVDQTPGRKRPATTGRTDFAFRRLQ